MTENKKMRITEKDNVHQEWYKEAKNVTTENLGEFVNKLVNEYGHDYGTICHAMAASAIAAAYAVDSSPTGGITVFQASAVMLEFIKCWKNINSPFKITDYNNLLYPQYEDSFTTISNDTWKWAQDEAKKNLESIDDYTSIRVVEHWQSIVDGKVPFGLKVSDE